MVSRNFSNMGGVPECCQSVFVYASGDGGCGLRWIECVLCIFQVPESRCPMAFMEIAAEYFSDSPVHYIGHEGCRPTRACGCAVSCE